MKKQLTHMQCYLIGVIVGIATTIIYQYLTSEPPKVILPAKEITEKDTLDSKGTLHIEFNNEIN